MSRKFSRRELLSAISLAAFPSFTAQAEKFTIVNVLSRIVIIGGGFAGASAALQLRRYFSSVTLIEPNSTYTACPFSNLVIAGYRPFGAQEFSYRQLRMKSINIIKDKAERIDPTTKTVKLRNGGDVPFDKLIISPGIDFQWNAIEGYDQAASEIMPHAWKAGAQTVLLRDQLKAMPDGGTVILSIPPPPFRCPPGPYERASLIAHYLKNHKPKSKLLVLDAQDNFSKKPLFEEQWLNHYGDIIERIPGSESGQVTRLDPKTKSVFTDFETFQGDVVNIIPPQKAGTIAHVSGAADASGWCPINATTFESSNLIDVHVIGDSTIAAPMPKSAFSANLQGKICALQIALMEIGENPIGTKLSNTCYSYFAPNKAFSVSGVYHNQNGQFSSVKGAVSTSPAGHYPELRRSEAMQAIDWFKAITQESVA